VSVQLRDGRRVLVHLDKADRAGLDYLAANALPTQGVKLRGGRTGVVHWDQWEPGRA